MTGPQDALIAPLDTISEHVPANPHPRPGDLGFDYPTAYAAQNGTLQALLAKHSTLTEENTALWEAAVHYSDTSLRALLERMRTEREQHRHLIGQLQHQNEALLRYLTEQGITLTGPQQVALSSAVSREHRRRRNAARQRGERLVSCLTRAQRRAASIRPDNYPDTVPALLRDLEAALGLATYQDGPPDSAIPDGSSIEAGEGQ